MLLSRRIPAQVLRPVRGPLLVSGPAGTTEVAGPAFLRDPSAYISYPPDTTVDVDQIPSGDRGNSSGDEVILSSLGSTVAVNPSDFNEYGGHPVPAFLSSAFSPITL
jgi:hypothetical protein